MHIFRKFFRRHRYSLILLSQLVKTDFRLRYQGSVLGYLWSLLRPLLLFVILYIVFVKFLRIGESIQHYPVYLLLGIVLWNFFAEITNNSVSAIVNRGDLIRKLNFPKYVIILSVAASALINLFFNLIVVGIFMYINNVDLTVQAVQALVYIGEIFVLGIGLSFILSALYVKLRDINYIWEVIMQAAFYATPVLYPLSLVSDRWPNIAQILLYNPIAQAIQDVRFLVVTKQTETLSSLGASVSARLIPFIIIILIVAFSVIFFKKHSPYFAEEV